MPNLKAVISENVESWCVALESGDYKQGHVNLRSAGNLFCCLGVACDLAVKAGVIKEPTLMGTKYMYGIEKRVGCLPEAVREWLGLRGDSADDELIKLNDGIYDEPRCFTFAEIAAYIRTRPRALFVDGWE